MDRMGVRASQPIGASLCKDSLPASLSQLLVVCPFLSLFCPSAPSTASCHYTCISGSSHPWGCPGCQTQTAFGDCRGRSTHRCGSSARSRFCGHHTTQDGREGRAGCPCRTNPLACCGDLRPPPPPAHLRLTCHGACAQPALAW